VTTVSPRKERFVRRGHTIGYVECTITDDENPLIAKAASTCMALRGQKVEGR
jgi:acyl-coenzyme A thioesterase PaaI-like protein